MVQRKKGSLLRTVRAVAWSLIGLRRGKEHEADQKNLHPLHVMLVGLVALVLFVLLLVGLVHWVV